MRANWKYRRLESAYELLKNQEYSYFDIESSNGYILANVMIKNDYYGRIRLFLSDKDEVILLNEYIGVDTKTARRRLKSIITNILKKKKFGG